MALKAGIHYIWTDFCTLGIIHHVIQPVNWFLAGHSLVQTILSQQQNSYYTRFSWLADMWLLFCRLKMEDMRMRVSISMWSWTFWRSPTYTWWENPWGNSRRWRILPSTNSTGSHLWTLHTGWSTSGWEHVTISQHCTMIRWSLYPDIHTREVSLMFLFGLLCFKIFI